MNRAIYKSLCAGLVLSVLSLFNTSAFGYTTVSVASVINSVVAPPPTTILVNSMDGDFIYNTHRLQSANIKIKLNSGSLFEYGFKGANQNFSITVGFDLVAYQGLLPVFSVINTAQLTIKNDQPESIFFKDFTTNADEITSFEIKNIHITSSNFEYQIPIALTTGGIASALKLVYEVEKTFAISVKPVSSFTSITILAPYIQDKQAVFNWNLGSSGYQSPNWEFQILKLNNKVFPPSNDPKMVTADLDWDKALKIETQSNKLSLKLTLNEGTGYYAWRVRPVGDFYEGGYANPANFGNYSDPVFSTSSVALTPLLSANPYQNAIFYFTDVADENINWIHTRTFSEENDVKEVIQYANGLNQGKQTQTYSPTENTRMVAQQIYDYSARPSLNPLPLPELNQNLIGYKTGVVMNNTGTALYSEDNFDDNNNLNSPQPISGPLTKYYSGTVLDNNKYPIPDAGPGVNEGYPFSRTTFYGDGTERHKESSGVGFTHMLGPQGSGMGRTTRTSYSTPADIELTRIFGDEAPNPKTVSKIEVVDPNNTTSITYKDITGKVIATCLSYPYDASTLDDIYNQNDPCNDNCPPEPFDVVNTTSTSVSTGNGFVSSTRLSLAQASVVDISYTYSCNGFQSCLTDGVVQCSYDVQFKIHDLDHPDDNSRNMFFSPIAVNCTSSVTPNYNELNQGSVFSVYGSSPNWKINCPPGNYLIEKILTYDPSNTQAVVTSNSSSANLLTVYNQILTYAISQIHDAASLTSFYSFNPCDPAYAQFNDLVAPVGCDYDFTGITFSFTTAPGGAVTGLNISTTCCGNMSVPMNFGDAFKFDCSNFSAISEYGTGGKMDFYGYLEKQMETPGVPNSGVLPAAMLLPGYSHETEVSGTYYNDFNLMIYHMLNDQYYTGRSYYDGTNLYVLNDDGSHTVPVSNSVQYQCDAVWKCWINVISSIVQLKNSMASQYSSGPGTAGGNVHDQNMNDGNTTDHPAKDESDNSADDNSQMSPIVKWLAGALLHNKMDEQPAGDVSLELLDNFLSCTEYKFAGIVVKNCNGTRVNSTLEDNYFPSEAIPILPLLQHTVGYVNNMEETLCPTGSVIVQPPFNVGLHPYSPSYDYRPVITTSSQYNNQYHIDLFDRIFAFKYFEYVDGCFNGGINNSNLELANCFYANTSETVSPPVCVPQPCSAFGYETWSSNQRLSFFLQLKSNPKPLPAETHDAQGHDVDQDQNPSPGCSTTDVEAYAHSVTQACSTTCETRRSSFRAAIVNKLIERCYIVDGCGPNSISSQQIDLLADMLVSNCTTQCAISPLDDVSCVPIRCSVLDDQLACTPSYTVAQYRKIELVPCKQLEIDQAKAWNFEVDFPDKCGSAEPFNRLFASSPPNVIPSDPQCVSGVVKTNFNVSGNSGRKSPIYPVFTLTGQ